jgi:hypothetical protein
MVITPSYRKRAGVEKHKDVKGGHPYLMSSPRGEEPYYRAGTFAQIFFLLAAEQNEARESVKCVKLSAIDTLGQVLQAARLQRHRRRNP